MELLKNRIVEQGKIIGDDIVKVDMFLNHQLDVALLEEMGKEIYRLFSDRGINKILTIETSGIAIACMAAQQFRVPVVFARKVKSRNISEDVYTAEVYSFTKNITYPIRVSQEYLNADDNLLIIDDFLANGKAVCGLLEIAEQSGAKVSGVCAAIEKGFQSGGRELREKGVPLKSLAIVDAICDGKITFRDEDC